MIKRHWTFASVSCRARLCESRLKMRRIASPPPTRKTAMNHGGRFTSHAATAPRTRIADKARTKAPVGDMNREIRCQTLIRCLTPYAVRTLRTSPSSSFSDHPSASLPAGVPISFSSANASPPARDFLSARIASMRRPWSRPAGMRVGKPAPPNAERSAPAVPGAETPAASPSSASATRPMATA